MSLLLDKERVVPTALTRKITLNGVTKVYPVYKIRIDALYYNDQNDRIASWISQYKDENKIESLLNIEREKYNDIIERFIVASNPASIEKTQMNIELVGQREPGVVLSDGRVIDGNRRYTCIRRLNKKDDKNCWFEAVILDIDLNDNKKMIKMLELTIQHGEEKRIDYNQVEKYIGIYQDIVDTELLTVEEYALSTNENVNEIKKRVEASKILVGFLDYINLPKQYHVARDLQIVSLANDLLELYKKCFDKNQREQVKQVAYLNILMDTVGDERKYIKNLNTIISNNMFDVYYEKQLEIEKKVFERLKAQNPRSHNEIRSFVRVNFDLAEELHASLDYALNNAKRTELFNEPSKIVSKVITSLRTIDTNIVSKLPESEIKIIKNQISSINNIVSSIEDAVGTDSTISTIKKSYNDNIMVEPVKMKKLEIVPSKYNDFVEINNVNKNKISNLLFKVSIRLMFENINSDYKLYFINDDYEICSNVIDIKLSKEFQNLSFQLSSKMSEAKKCYLVVKKDNDAENEARFLIEYNINMVFGSGFDF